MKTYVSLHDITRITATTPGSLGAPVILQLHDDAMRRGDITIFLGDHDLAMRIAAAINDAVCAPTLQDVAAEDAEIAAREAETRLYDDNDEGYNYAADDMAFDAAREDRMFRR